MIEEAEQKSKKYNVELFNEDIRNINVIFKDLRFKEIFCIGNSLVHLPFKSEIEDVIKKSYKILQNGGVFIVSIINYDRIIEKNIKEMIKFRSYFPQTAPCCLYRLPSLLNSRPNKPHFTKIIKF